MNYLELFGKTLPATNVAFISAILMSALLWKFIYKGKLASWYVDSFIVYVAAWKFSYIIFSYSLFIDNPFTILYFDGGVKGQIIGLVAASVYLYTKLRKEPFVPSFLSYYVLFYTSYQTIHSFFTIDIAEIVTNLIIFSIVLIAFAYGKKKDSSWIAGFLVLYLFIQLLSQTMHHSLIDIESLNVLVIVILSLFYISWYHREFPLKKSLAQLIILILITLVVENTLTLKELKETTPASVTIAAQLGHTAPDFELTTLTGERIKLSDYRGQTVILNFWATWCPPCRAEMPHMQSFHENQPNIVLLAVNLTKQDKGIGTITEFVEDYGLTFTIPLDENGKIGELYQINTIPTSYIINPDGIIREKVIGPMDEARMTQLTAP